MEKTLAMEIKEKLHKGIVTFTFRKKDGTIREARATLHTDHLVRRGVIADTKVKKTSSPKVQVFYDLDKDEWRCFVIGTEQEILEYHPL